MFLESIGAGASIFGAFESYRVQGLFLARVATAQRERYHLLAEDGEYEAEPSGAFWYRGAGLPATGDWVAARAAGGGLALVEATLPRSGCISRRAAGRRQEEQVLAANVDLVFLVCGLDGDYNPRRIERYLALAAESGAQAVVALNKADLGGDLESRLEEARIIAGATPVVAVSALAGPLEAIEAHLAPGRTVAFLGSSGAGKSTLVNRLLGEERLRTGEVRESDSRGRHTTTRRELIPLAGRGALIDTPGLREVGLWAGVASVESVFDSIAALAAQCRYRDCAHSGEKGCAVEAAAAAGELDEARLASYRKLMGEARRQEALGDPMEALAKKRRDRALHKAIKQHFKMHEKRGGPMA